LLKIKALVVFMINFDLRNSTNIYSLVKRKATNFKVAVYFLSFHTIVFEHVLGVITVHYDIKCKY